MKQQMNYNQDHKISNWWYILIVVTVFVIGVIIGSNKACAQSPAIVKGYIEGQYTETIATADYVLSEDNRSMDFIINGNTISYAVITEKMVILEDSVVRTEYHLNKRSVMVIEPIYDNGQYAGDYCKMIMRDVDPFDKMVIIFRAEPNWSEANRRVAGYQYPAGIE